MPYIGRYAPSPTGPLHFGSLIAAVASYCDAKSQAGKWLLRIEDLDKPREVKGATDVILRQLARFGFEWDDDIIFQSQRTQYYAEALEQLKKLDLVYPCTCTRKEIADSSNIMGVEGLVYPNSCLQQPTKSNEPAAYRIKTNADCVCFHDVIQGEICQNLSTDIGDFVLKRADGLFAYQLAVVVDDAASGITHIVRGCDLLNSTPRQIYLQKLLGLKPPIYAHLPVATNAGGEKLSKQTKAESIDMYVEGKALFRALTFLGQQPPAETHRMQPQEIWGWAIANWRLNKIPHQKCIFYNNV